MKSLKITREADPNTGEVGATSLSASIYCLEEGWGLHAQVREGKEDTYRELVEITVTMHDGTAWTGTIQDLSAIRQYAINSAETLNNLTYSNMQSSTADCITELKTLLGHFSHKPEFVSELNGIGLLRSQLRDIEQKIKKYYSTIQLNETATERLGHANENILDAISNLNLALQEML